MQIKELLESTYRVESVNKSANTRHPSYVFSQKKFGSIYTYNKTLLYKPDSSIIELDMVIGVYSEKNKSAHRVSIALKGIESQEYTTRGIIDLIKSENVMFNESEDSEVIKLILEEKKLLKGKTIIQKDTAKDKFIVIHNRIPLKTEIRVKCSCFSGDTEILMGDGTYKTLKELEGKNNFEVISYNKNNDRYEITKGIKCELKQKDARTITITLDNGTEIKTTPEHRFLTREGIWVEAQHLIKNQSLKAIYLDTESNTAKVIRTDRVQTLNKHKQGNRFYVYLYLDPRKVGNFNYGSIDLEFEPFYVGKGTRNRMYDFKGHSKECLDKIGEIQAEGLEPIIVKQYNSLEEHVSLEIEEKLINKIGLDSNGGSLVNKLAKGTKSNTNCSEKQITNMKKNNPMKRQEIICKVRETSKRRGHYKKQAIKMVKNNPMKDKKTVYKVKETNANKGLYSRENMKRVSEARTKETFNKIVKTRLENNPDSYKKWCDAGNISRLNKIKNGTYHTQQEDWKKEQSLRSKNSRLNSAIIYIAELVHKYGEFKEEYYKNSRGHYTLETLIKKDLLKYVVEEATKITLSDEYKYKYLNNRDYGSCKYENKLSDRGLYNLKKSAIKYLVEILKKYGEFKDEYYIYRNGYPSLLNLKKRGLLNDLVMAAKEEAFINHKVIKIVENNDKDDVYCITVDSLGNFVVKSEDKDSTLKSGIVVENCSDYLYTFSWYNADHKAHIGRRPPKYIKFVGLTGKEKSNTTTVRNPKKLPGVCKHLLLFLALLMEGNIINESTPITSSFSKNSNKMELLTRQDITELNKKLKDELKNDSKIKELQRIKNLQIEKDVKAYKNVKSSKSKAGRQRSSEKDID